MKKILFITSQYRVGERIYTTLPKLAQDYEIDLYKIYQMNPSHKWVGDNDMRKIFDEKYSQYFNEVKELDLKKYDLIISDDNRNTPKTKLAEIYSKKSCPMIGCVHGNSDKNYFSQSYGRVFDYEFTFGVANCSHKNQIPIGIPSNDILKVYTNEIPKHILVIVNFLGNRYSPFRPFTKKLLQEIQLKEIQDKIGLPIIFKLKSRADEGGYGKNLKYLSEIAGNLDYSVVVDSEDDNLLIAQSKCVISAPSTLAFKPLQLNIPTLILNKTGQMGNFKTYTGTDKKVNNFIDYLENNKNYSIFVRSNIEGGTTFSSTDVFIKRISELI